ncbi:MAG: type II/IV secretion system protein [Firmicutes bacterium]|nr:type II/IV secretion system protein [Bacillota bacterium]
MLKNEVNLVDSPPEADAIYTIPAELAQKHHVLPVKIADSILYLAMSDPANVVAIDEVKLTTGYDICPLAADQDQLAAEIANYYGALDSIIRYANNEKESGGNEEIPCLTVSNTKTLSTTDIIHSLFEQAIQQRASDIHLEPTTDGGQVRFRIDGILHLQVKLDIRLLTAVVTSLKVQSGMDIAQRLSPQDGRMELNCSNQQIDVRLASLPTIKGEKLVLRLLNRSTRITNIDKLGLTTQVRDRLHRFLKQSGGILLVTGPTGCGKTTTLYTILQQLNTMEKNIITIEDPVEYYIPGINQVQVNSKAGINFANGLRAILRQDPNIIMVGEIRDHETATMAVRAALTGHLVLSTLHTKDAASAITRLLDMGIEPYLLASAISGVMAQRLVRCLCPNCSQTRTPDKEEQMLLKQHGIVRTTLKAGRGCSLCRYTGFQGRTAIAEILDITSAIQQLIYNCCTTEEIRQQAIKEGMVPLLTDGLLKAATGQTTISEVIQAVN